VQGIEHDAAVVGGLVVTQDALVEGVHFRREWGPPQLAGRKALAVNLSDIDAMGGVPRYATVSLCLPADTPFGFVEGLYDGLLERAAQSGVPIVGGNLSGTANGIVVDVTLLGDGDRILPRGGARPGDVAVVTGTLGAAAMGLRLLGEGKRITTAGEGGGAVRHCLAAQLDPAPPLGFGNAVAGAGLAHAAIDLSVGLSGDLRAVCQESGVAAWLDAGTLPIDPAVAELGGGDASGLALHGGEDYQLLLAADPGAVPALRELASRMSVPLAVVGGFSAGEPAVSLRTADGVVPLPPRSHEHFGGRA
jgi:thiamine-monophosphate kinase